MAAVRDGAVTAEFTSTVGRGSLVPESKVEDVGTGVGIRGCASMRSPAQRPSLLYWKPGQALSANALFLSNYDRAAAGPRKTLSTARDLSTCAESITGISTIPLYREFRAGVCGTEIRAATEP